MAEFSSDKLMSWLNAKDFAFKCLVCGSEEWVPGEDLVRISSPSPGLHWGQPFRGAYVYCAVCGYTMFFDAEKLPLDEA